MNFNQILNYYFWNNSLKEYLIALGVFVLTIIALKIFKYIIIVRIKKLAKRTRTDIDDLLIKVIDSIGWGFYVFLSIYIALQFLLLPQILEKIVDYLLLIVVVYYVVKGVQVLIDFGTQKFITRREGKAKKLDTSATKLLARILKWTLWVVAILVVLQNFGYNVSALVAGLGIGGVAIAFALQNILEDLFASFAIYFDKPFQVGDFIVIGDDLGTVQHIGIKSTRIQTLKGEELIVSNKELTEIRVHNYKKMEKRRIVFTFGVLRETETEKLKKIPDMVRKIIDEMDIADTERIHFKEFAEYGLNFEVVYHLNSNDYNVYMDTQQEINVKIKEAFEREGISMAYPTQTVFVKK